MLPSTAIISFRTLPATRVFSTSITLMRYGSRPPIVHRRRRRRPRRFGQPFSQVGSQVETAASKALPAGSKAAFESFLNRTNMA